MKRNQLLPLNYYVNYPYYAPTNNKRTQLVLLNGKKRDTIPTATGIGTIHNSRLLTGKAGEYLFCSGGDKLFRISPSKNLLVTSLKGNIISLYTDRDNGVWAGTHRNGLYYYSSAGDSKKYVQLLEQYRFEHKFEYELEISDTINILTVSLPPMLIQPYVENAIWHGLLNLPAEQKGKLTLHFLSEGQLLKVIVLDNGVGRQKAAYQKEGSHAPVAMELTAKRLDMVHQIWGNDAIKVKITDLYDEKKNPIGTQVALYLPLNIQRYTATE